KCGFAYKPIEGEMGLLDQLGRSRLWLTITMSQCVYNDYKYLQLGKRSDIRDRLPCLSRLPLAYLASNCSD
ncbi:MAG: hypothetical protein AAFY67_09615, partial [Cyanobacteria bacterium J06642_9]